VRQTKLAFWFLAHVKIGNFIGKIGNFIIIIIIIIPTRSMTTTTMTSTVEALLELVQTFLCGGPHMILECA